MRDVELRAGVEKIEISSSIPPTSKRIIVAKKSAPVSSRSAREQLCREESYNGMDERELKTG